MLEVDKLGQVVWSVASGPASDDDVALLHATRRCG